MILTGDAIRQAILDRAIEFEPFADEKLNPNSIDLHLGDAIAEVVVVGDGAEPAYQPLTPEGLLLTPGCLYLARSRECFGSNRFAPMVHGKSNIARAGMFVHVNGELVDVGVVNHFEFQLVPMLPIRVRPGMAIAQVTFWAIAHEISHP